MGEKFNDPSKHRNELQLGLCREKILSSVIIFFKKIVLHWCVFREKGLELAILTDNSELLRVKAQNWTLDSQAEDNFKEYGLSINFDDTWTKLTWLCWVYMSRFW